MPVTGAKAHSARLRKIAGSGTVSLVSKALRVGGELLQTTAQQSITEGAVSGKGHVASRPGEAPNQDTSVLANNIETIDVAPLEVDVSSNTPYAVALEYGTSKMEERPYMRPATKQTRPEIVRIITSAVNAAIADSGKGNPTS